MSFGSLLDACVRVCASDAELIWAPTERLLAAGLSPWMGVPLWVAAAGWEAANQVVIDRALAAGHRFRPVVETIEAVLRGGPPAALSSFTREQEQPLLGTG